MSSYTTVVGSDVGRDGFFAELYSSSGGSRVLVAEAFWAESSNEFTVCLERCQIPFSVLEEFIAEARMRVPPSGQRQESNLFRNGYPSNGA